MDQFPNLRVGRPREQDFGGWAAVKRVRVVDSAVTTSSVVYDRFLCADQLAEAKAAGWIWIYLSRIADTIRRASTTDRPLLWRLKDSERSNKK
jgi:hypothetical protein